MMPTTFSNIVINLDIWRLLGFGASIVGFSCFALGSSFQELFGQWNLLKIVLYSTVSFIFSVLMLFVKYSQRRFPKVFWLKTQWGFLVLMLTSLYSYYEDRSKQGETKVKRYHSILSLISFGAFALMSMSLSAQIRPGFEVGMSNFFLGCLVVGVMKMSFKIGAGVAVLCYVVMSIRSFSDSQQESRRRGGDALHEVVVEGDSLHEETPAVLSPLSIHPSHSTLRHRSVNGSGFNKSKAVKLRSHLDKYLVADEDREEVRQSRNGSSRKAQWVVEPVEGKDSYVRLKSCHGRYLTATAMPFLLGMTGNRVVQADFEPGSDWEQEWKVIRDGSQVKLKSWCGTYLRGNGGMPPWRNSVTHDEPYSSATQDWVLWDFEAVTLLEDFDSVSSSVSDPATSPMSAFSMKSPMQNSNLQRNSNKFRSGMEFFQSAKAVRLRSHHNKYLLAEEDEESVTQDRNGSSKNARWVLESVPGYDFLIRLKSCYGKYLTASNEPFLLGVTGLKVLQTLPGRLDSSVEWEPVRDGSRVKLKTRYGNFLRANGGVPPWSNSVTHDNPRRTATQDWVLWNVDVVEIHVQSSPGQNPTAPPLPHSDSLDFESTTKSPIFLRQESSDSNVDLPGKVEGRTIYYHVAEDDGVLDEEGVQGYSMIFRGSGVEELTRKLEEETGLQGIIVCSRSPLNGKLCPLRLHLPPHNVTMQVVLVLPSSKVARDFEQQGLL